MSDNVREQYWYQMAVKQQKRGFTGPQERVLRRKKAHIAEVVEATDELIQNIFERELIKEDVVQELQEHKLSSSQTIAHLIDAMVTCETPDAFGRFIDLLVDSYPNLVQELVIEVRYEEGASCVPKEVADEANTLVYRKFGASKRFGFGDKQGITDLLAVRMQLLNEEWEVRMQSTVDRVAYLEKEVSTRDKITEAALQRLAEFVTIHRHQLNTYAHDMSTTTEALEIAMKINDKKPALKLKDVNEKFLQNVIGILAHREKLLSERSQAFEELAMQDHGQALDTAIRVTMKKPEVSKLPDKVSNGGGTALDEDGRITVSLQTDVKRLNKKVTELEGDVVERDDLNAKLQQELVRTRNSVTKLQDELAESRRVRSADDLSRKPKRDDGRNREPRVKFGAKSGYHRW